MGFRQGLNKLFNSIGTKIIFPYVLLTIIVAGIGAFIVTNLVTGTLQERFDNQLLDSGRVVAEIMVDYEQTRLSVLRAVAGTEGVPKGVASHNIETIEALVPQIIANRKETLPRVNANAIRSLPCPASHRRLLLVHVIGNPPTDPALGRATP